VTRPHLVLTRRWPASVEAELALRYDVELNEDDQPMDAPALRSAMQRADALCPTVTDNIDADVIGVGEPGARLIASFGVGFNHIDLEAAVEQGVAVTNTPDVLTDCTADLTIALMLMCARRAGEGERELRAGRWAGWRPTHLTGTRVTGKTLGIIGMGRIGQAVARRAVHGFGMRLLCYNRSPVAPEVLEAFDARQVSDVDQVLASADFVSLHCPANEDTHHLIDARGLALMPDHAHLVNTARGNVVDEAALSQALRDGAIRGAGLDVYEREPYLHEGLLALDNVVLLPHLGSATIESRTAMGMRVLHNLDAFFAGEALPDGVVG